MAKAKIILPNQKLIKDLFMNYYASDNTPKNLVSSHWEYFSGKFNVQLDNDGNIRSLSGSGFGDMVGRAAISKILDYLCNLSYFIRLPYKKDLSQLILKGIKICNSMEIDFSFDCFKQVCSLSLIRRNLSENMKKKNLTFLVIGDGYGFLSSLIKDAFPESTIVLVDLGKTLLFQSYYCQKAHPEGIHYGIQKNIMFDINDKYDFIYCPTELLDKASMLNYDITINIASMQEMNYLTIERYFDFIRKKSNNENLFYCCNREKKVLRGGEILEFEKYPWSKKDRHLVDEYCPWYKYYFSFRSKKGPAISNVRLPLVNYFDGPIRHRLTIMAKKK